MPRLRKSEIAPENYPSFSALVRLLCYPNPSYMTALILYDIGDDRIRTYVSKYLLRNGCERVQKSVFVVHLSRKEYDAMSSKLAKVNEMYASHDSIIIIPLHVDTVTKIHCIGKDTHIHFAPQHRHVLIV